jgi:hypothetical protein
MVINRDYGQALVPQRPAGTAPTTGSLARGGGTRHPQDA